MSQVFNMSTSEKLKNVALETPDTKDNPICIELNEPIRVDQQKEHCTIQWATEYILWRKCGANSHVCVTGTI